MDRTDLYWQRRLGELERRIEKLEAKSNASAISPGNSSEFYTVEEFAAALGVCRLTVQRKIKAGMINGIKIGKIWRIPKSEIDRIFEEQNG